MNVTLSGYLVDPNNNYIPNATISLEAEKTSTQTLKSTSAQTSTNSGGYYEITVPYGTYTIKVKQSGYNAYQTIAKNVRINSGTTATNLNDVILETVTEAEASAVVLQVESLKAEVLQVKNETQALRDEVVGIQIDLQGSVDTMNTYETRLSTVESNTLTLDPTLAPVDGEVLVYNGTGGYFESTNYVPVASLSDLTDVDTTGVVTGDYLKYNGTIFTPITPSISDNSDVTLTTPVNGEVLVYNNGQFVNMESQSGWDDKEVLTINTGVVDIDLASAKGFYVDLTENITQMNFINADVQDFIVFSIVFKQDATGGRTISYPSEVIGPLFQPYNSPQAVTIMSFLTYDGGLTIYQSDISLDSQIDGLVTIGQVDGLQTELNTINTDVSNIDTRLVAVEGSTINVTMGTLGDVDLTGLTTGQILEYDGVNFVPVPQPTLPSSYVEYFNDLIDVNVSTAVSGEYLYFDGSVFTTTSLSVPTTISDLNDVVISTPQHNDSIVWNSITSRFENKAISGTGSTSTIVDLTDVTITNPTNNQLLRYDTSVNKWTNWTLPSYATNLTGLSDVTISSAATNQVLKRTPSGWINAAVNITDVPNLQTALDGKANVSHIHSIVNVTGLQTALDGKTDTGHVHSIANVTGLQFELDDKASLIHNHAIADVTGLQVALDGKTDTGHVHTIANVTGLQVALDGKTDTGHGHAIADVTGLQAELDGKAATSHSHVIADVTGLQIALDSKTEIGHTHVIDDVIGLQTELNSKTNTGHVHTIANVTGLQAELDKVNTTGATDGQILVYNAVASAFEPSSIATSVTTMSDLTDVDVTGIGEGQILEWDGLNFVPVFKPIDITSLGQIPNVDTNGQSVDKILKFNGTNWVVSNVDYSEITSKPTLSTVAGTGDYNDLLNQPVLFSGSYTDLTNKPTIPSGVNDLSDVDTTGFVTGQVLKSDGTNWLASSVDYSEITNTPALFSGSYTDLTNKPVLSTVATSGDYNDLINQPVLTTTLVDLTDTTITTPTDGQVIVWDNVNSKWINEDIDYTPVQTQIDTINTDVTDLQTVKLEKLGGTPYLDSISSDSRFYFLPDGSKKYVTSEVLGIFNLSPTTYVQLESVTDGTSFGGNAYVYDLDGVEQFSPVFVTSDFLLDQEIEIIDYDVNTDYDSWSSGTIYEVTILAKYVYQGSTTFYTLTVRHVPNMTSEPFGYTADSKNQDSTFNNATSVAMGNEVLYVAYENDSGGCFLHKKEKSNSGVTVSPYQLNILESEIMTPAVNPKVKVNSSNNIVFVTSASTFQNTILEATIETDGTITYLSNYINLSTANPLDWRMISDDVFISVDATNVKVDVRPSNTVYESEIVHGLTTSNTLIHMDYWHKKLSLDNNGSIYDLNVNYNELWTEKDIYSKLGKLLTQKTLDDQNFEISKINNLQSEIDRIDGDISTYSTDITGLSESKLDKHFVSIESTESFVYNRVAGYVPFDIIINGTTVTVTQESTEFPGIALEGEIADAINTAAIPDILVDEAITTNIRIKNTRNGVLEISDSGNDFNGNPVVGPNSGTGWAIGINEPEAAPYIVKQSDVYGLTDILNNIRVENLTEVVDLLDTEVIVTLVNITVGDTPQVFVDGVPIVDFTVDSPTQITLGTAYSTGARKITVIQSNVRFD